MYDTFGGISKTASLAPLQPNIVGMCSAGEKKGYSIYKTYQHNNINQTESSDTC